MAGWVDGGANSLASIKVSISCPLASVAYLFMFVTYFARLFLFPSILRPIRRLDLITVNITTVETIG